MRYLLLGLKRAGWGLIVTGLLVWYVCARWHTGSPVLFFALVLATLIGVCCLLVILAAVRLKPVMTLADVSQVTGLSGFVADPVQRHGFATHESRLLKEILGRGDRVYHVVGDDLVRSKHVFSCLVAFYLARHGQDVTLLDANGDPEAPLPFEKTLRGLDPAVAVEGPIGRKQAMEICAQHTSRCFVVDHAPGRLDGLAGSMGGLLAHGTVVLLIERGWTGRAKLGRAMSALGPSPQNLVIALSRFRVTRD